MPTRRQRRVAEQIHRELSLLLLREVSDPRLADVTLTEVRVTPDLLIARIYYSVMGDDQAKAEAKVGLQSAMGFLRTQVAERVQLRFAPELIFDLDTTAEYAQRIEELLQQISTEHPEDSNPDGAGETGGDKEVDETQEASDEQ